MASRGMSEQAFFVLSALADEPRYGYEILTEVAELSEGRMCLRVGTLYGILARMAADGTVELDREEVVDSRLRRYYRLSDQGRQALTREAARQAANARIATQRLGVMASWASSGAAGSQP